MYMFVMDNCDVNKNKWITTKTKVVQTFKVIVDGEYGCTLKLTIPLYSRGKINNKHDVF